MAAPSRVASKQLKTQEDMLQQLTALTKAVILLTQEIQALKEAQTPKQEKTGK